MKVALYTNVAMQVGPITWAGDHMQTHLSIKK